MKGNYFDFRSLFVAISVLSATQACKANGISVFIRDFAAEILKGVAIEGLSKDLMDAIKDKSSVPVEQYPVLQLSWNIWSFRDSAYVVKKTAGGQVIEWSRAERQIFTRWSQGEPEQHFLISVSHQGNPQDTIYNHAFDPGFAGNFKFECREERPGGIELFHSLETASVIELFLKARNFNVPITDRGLHCKVKITEQFVPAGCPSEPLPDKVRVGGVNVRWNSAATLPGVPAKSHILLAIKEDAITAWE